MEAWWQIPVVIGVALLLWLPQNAFHEGCHALVVHLLGGKVTSFKPFVHKRNGKWYFASMSWNSDKTFTNRQRAYISVAPWIGNALIIVVTSAMNVFGSHKVGSAILLGWTVVNFMDFANNARFLIFADQDKYETGTADIIRFSRAWWSTLKTSKWRVGFCLGTVLGWLVVGAIPW